MSNKNDANNKEVLYIKKRSGELGLPGTDSFLSWGSQKYSLGRGHAGHPGDVM